MTDTEAETLQEIAAKVRIASQKRADALESSTRTLEAHEQPSDPVVDTCGNVQNP